MNRKELLGILWEGFSASLRKEKDTISTPIIKVFQNNSGRDDYNLRLLELSSSDKDRGMEEARKMLQLINPSKVAFIGKSLGGICVKEFLETHKNILNPIQYGVLLVDPHGAMAGDGEIGPYNKNQSIKLNVKEDTQIICIKQEETSPTGASVKSNSSNDVNNIILSNYDHYNIINAKEVKESLDLIIDNLIWR